jgi:hypothetical protein
MLKYINPNLQHSVSFIYHSVRSRATIIVWRFFFLITIVHIQRSICMIDGSIFNFFTCHSIAMTYNKWLLYVIFDVLYLTSIVDKDIVFSFCFQKYFDY